MPAATAFSDRRSTSMPLPSSVTSRLIWLPDWRAAKRIRPISRLPFLSRLTGFSIPWSMALRMMWVSGSRTISIISRSSSTSPPSKSTMTCLPSSFDRSRTRRGSEENRCSRRCIRIRVIEVRTSARIADRRSNGPSMVGCSPASRRRRARSLRASTMSETPFITSSSRSTGRRMDRCTDCRWPLAGASSPASSTTSCWTVTSLWISVGPPASSAAISASSSLLPSSSPASMASVMAPMRSMMASTAETSALSGSRRPARHSASASSAAWLSRSSCGKSKKPQLPLTVWTKRKIVSMRALSDGSASQATSSVPLCSSISRVSAMKSASNSSMIFADPLYLGIAMDEDG